jgi:conjugative relaxase-like TrwC/TraI family protein
MTLVKMSPGAWRYYAEEIASGREDYWVEGARVGKWWGGSADALGIENEEVAAEQLERLFGRGLDPTTGGPLGRAIAPDDARAVAGFAMTFSPPKSVSVLWALGGDAALGVMVAHANAASTALTFLEEHAAFTRRGRNGIHQVDTKGLFAATFTHRTSRAADPQLHTHVLVANKVQAFEGTWLTLDARELYEHQKAAGMLYKSALRAEVTARLGVQWTAVDENGGAEIKGVPEGLIARWSTRREEVTRAGEELIAQREVELSRRLTANERAEVLQLAAYQTRAPKVTGSESTGALLERWHAEAEVWGYPARDWLEPLLFRPVRAAPWGEPEIAAAIEHTIGILEDAEATWGRADAVEVLSNLVPGRSAEEVRDCVERATYRLLAHKEIRCLAAPLPAEPPDALRRRDGMAVVERHGAVRFTTATTLQREAYVFNTAARRLDARVGVVRDADALLANSSLGEDQRDAVHALLTGGEGMALLVGPAGTGKSRSLAAARAAWEAAGYRVVGLAPSAMAAAVLEEESGIHSETLAMFLRQRENGHPDAQLNSRTVLVVDEASMARTLDLMHLAHDTEKWRAKLVLVGDPNQLGAVGAGGIFAALVGDRMREGHRVAELETVRRFHHAWEAAASLRLRAHDPAILVEYQRHERIDGGTREQMIDAAFKAWQGQRAAGRSVVVMAGDNATVDEIARRCRAERVQRGEVERDGVPLARGTVGVGDEIVTLRNERSLRTAMGEFVRNGERWQVTARDRHGALSVSSLDGRGSLTLPADYVNEHVALAYALTIHKAQGTTTDAAVLVVNPSMTAPQLYVGMSRGREENRALVICEELDLDHGRDRIATPIEVLGSVMRRDDGDLSAHEVMRRELSRYENRAFLTDLIEEARQQITWDAGPDHTTEIKRLAAEHERELQRLYWAEKGCEKMANLMRKAELQLEAIKQDIAQRRGANPNATISPLLESRLEQAENTVRSIARHEHRTFATLESARHDAFHPRAAAHLDGLREAQAHREEWIAQHPKEVAWTHGLEEQLAARTREAKMARATRGPEHDELKLRGASRYPINDEEREAEIERDLELENSAVTEESVTHKPRNSYLERTWVPDFDYGGPTAEERGITRIDRLYNHPIIEVPTAPEVNGPEIGM